MDLRHDESARCSDHRLDRYLAGELDAAGRSAFEAHLADSEPCRRRWEALAEDRRRFLVRPTPVAFREPSGERRRLAGRPGRLALVGTLAAAASLGVAFWSSGDAGSVRSKGPAFVVHAARDGTVRELVAGGLVRAGDRLRFSFPGAGGRWVAVVGRDGSGRTAPYLPAEGDAVRLQDASHPLDGAVVLDAVPGAERLYGFACEAVVPVAHLTAAVSGAAADAAPVVAGCAVHRLALEKEPEAGDGR